MDHDFLDTLETALNTIMDLNDMERGDDCASDGEHGSLTLSFPGGAQYRVSFTRTR